MPKNQNLWTFDWKDGSREYTEHNLKFNLQEKVDKT